jgi:hypothetical protein
MTRMEMRMMRMETEAIVISSVSASMRGPKFFVDLPKILG